MSFLQALEEETNLTLTDNGAVTNASSLDNLLDFFASAGAMRKSPEGAVELFKKAYASDPLSAIKILFYLRDVRGGQGEKNVFRKCIESLDIKEQRSIRHYIPVYGRWDDIFCLYKEAYLDFVVTTLHNDLHSDKPSLLAKWIPTENCSNKERREQAIEIIKCLGMSKKTYRQVVSELRKKIDVVERKMSAKKWEDIIYPHVPSLANKRYSKSFKKHDEVRYGKYLELVKSGKEKINVSTLYTYDVFDMLQKDPEVADIMWKNLPDYTNGDNALVVADVSGSMMGRPMSVSVSLALYFAERNKGAFHNYFMTFSENPQLVKVTGQTLKSKMAAIERSNWGMNTNIERVFDVILKTAKDSKAAQDELPKIVYIVSDMIFDSCVEADKTIFKNAKKNFESEGYELPHIVFWNVNSSGKNYPVNKYDQNVTLISGSSQSTFKYAVQGKSPLDLMNDVINSDRYKDIKLMAF